MNQNTRDLIHEARSFSNDGEWWVLEEPEFSFVFLATKEFREPVFFTTVHKDRPILRMIIQTSVQKILFDE